MSRIGKKPISIPQGVKVTLGNDTLSVEGPKGKLQMKLNDRVQIQVDDKSIVCSVLAEQALENRKYQGLIRSLVSNMVQGCFEGFRKELDINGVGYRAAVNGQTLELSLGFSHPIRYAIPEGINLTVEKQTSILIQGPDRKLVGQTAAEIRGFRNPEPYKGKGIKYREEVIRRKVGKSAAATGSAGGSS